MGTFHHQLKASFISWMTMLDKKQALTESSVSETLQSSVKENHELLSNTIK